MLWVRNSRGVVEQVRVLDSRVLGPGFRWFQVTSPATLLPGYIAHTVMCLYCFSVFHILSLYYVFPHDWQTLGGRETSAGCMKVQLIFRWQRTVFVLKA